MSNVSSSHNIVTLDKSSKALSGQRLARVIAKKNKDGIYESSNLTESKCVSLPPVDTNFSAEQIKALTPHIAGMLQDAQDNIIRNAIITRGVSSIHDDEISVNACIAYLDDSGSGRITSEYLLQWFTESYAAPAMQFICHLVKFDAENLSDEQCTVVEQKTNVLRDMFKGFASGKYSPDIPKCKAILKFGEFLGQENCDDRMSLILEKTAKIKEEKEKELSVDALGF